MEGKSSAKESSEPNDDEDTKDEVDNKDEGDKDEDDELETQCWGHYHFNSHSNYQGWGKQYSYLTECEENLPKNTKMAAKINQFQIRSQLHEFEASKQAKACQEWN